MQRCKALSDTRNPTLLKQVVEDILVVRNAYSSVYDWRRYRARYLQNPFLKALDPVLERSLNRPDSIRKPLRIHPKDLDLIRWA